MCEKFPCVLAILLTGALTTPMSVGAQGLETVGARAAALGAFVAVADDASAVVWNPSGLVGGPIFNVSIGLGRSRREPADPPARGHTAQQISTTLVAIGTTPVGLGYYRIATTAIDAVNSAVVPTSGREEGHVIVRKLTTTHLGATVQQSLGDYLTLGATLKLVRGNVAVASGAVSSWSDAFDVNVRDARGSTRGDLDAGAMLSLGRVRAGVVLRNATAPTFGDREVGETVTLKRHARAGIAWANQWPGISRTIVALDADLTRVPHVAGDRRDVAAGVERWWRSQRIAVRGGVRGSTVGDARAVVSIGGSYAVRAGTFVDAYLAKGARDEHAWGIAARLAY